MRATPRPPYSTFALVGAQLLLMLAVVVQYRLENRGFLHLLILVILAFPVHGMLPLAWRPAALLGLSLLALGIVLTPGPALLLVALGTGLIALCHLPLPWTARYGVLLLAGLCLAWLRLEGAAASRLGLDSLGALWPILGSMFMFRLLVYLHDLRYGKLPPSKVWTLNYFFLLPNVCFPLFPVVDYKTLRKTYYQVAAADIYRRGGRWMARGLWQLILYRAVYHYLALDPTEVDGTWSLLQYMLASFLLYLRVSGHFHLIIGILLLFGCNLPETHHRYFLASSLSDFWRRINIYWKDFMAKVVFFPSHDRLRRLGPRWALALATAWVFVVTWLLHAYQWFWITGAGLLTWSDVLFWLILGLLVVLNVLWDSRPGRRRTAPRQGQPWAHGMRVLATFLLLTVLWSLWTTESLALWLHLWSTAPALAPVLLLIVIGLWLAAPSVAKLGSPLGKRSLAPKAQGRGRDLATLLLLGGLALLGRPPVQGWLAAQLPAEAGARLARLGESLRSNELNQRDAAAQRQGYYEQLIAVPLDNPGLHALYARRPADWRRIDETTAWRPVDGLRRGELVPGAQIQFKQATLTINRWGLRDGDYPKERTPGLPRLAVLGSSHTMGSGVADDATFEHLFEQRWNKDHGPLESLNFAVAGHSAIEDMALLDERVLAFQPDVILEVAHTHDLGKAVRFLANALADGQTIHHPALAPILELAGATPGQPRSVLEHRLRPHRWQILDAVYRHMAQTCRSHGITPRWLLLPLVGEGDNLDMDHLVNLAHNAGFEVLDLRHIYDGHSVDELRLASWDDHPNGVAHGLVAEGLLGLWGDTIP